MSATDMGKLITKGWGSFNTYKLVASRERQRNIQEHI
jgi:hypothetical protein